MEEAFLKAKEILIKYNQEHLLSFYDELDDDQKNFLLNQILTINFEQILNLYKKSFEEDHLDLSSISPLPYIVKDNLDYDEKKYYAFIGNEAIQKSKVAVITLAGGQGTRLRAHWS